MQAAYQAMYDADRGSVPGEHDRAAPVANPESRIGLAGKIGCNVFS